MDAAIRKATAADAQGILDCLRLAFEPCRDRYTQSAYADTVLGSETIHQRLATMTVLVAVSEAGEIVGTIGYQVSAPGEGHMRGMAVWPSWQGAGTAQRLLDTALAELRIIGCSQVTLDTTEVLHRATRFYLRNGFRPSGRIGDFFGMPLIEYTKEIRVDLPRADP